MYLFLYMWNFFYKKKNNFVWLDLVNKGIDIYKGKLGDRGIDFLYRLVFL